MFEMAQKLEIHVCIRCGKEITSEKDFTIDHVKPWRNIDKKLFWDTANIGFAHSKCNVPHRIHNPNPRKIRPKNMGWCSRCKEFLPEKEFWKNKSTWHGLANECKECYKYRKKLRKDKE